MSEKESAISCCTREREGRLEYLVVWNKKHKAWVFPGGKVEPGETVAQAQARELREEAGVETVSAHPIFKGPSCIEPDRTVYAFSASYRGTPHEAEPGAPVTWMTQEEILAGPHFAPYYEDMFQAITRPWEVPVNVSMGTTVKEA